MAFLLKQIYKGYFWIFNELADPRANENVFSFSPMVPAVIIGSYIYFIFVAGPKLMQNRKPFQLKNVLIVYNLCQILLNVMLLCQAGDEISHMNLQCNPIDYSQSPEAKRTYNRIYYFYLLKILDLADTIFMVLRKNTRQITFLHVYHHWGMVFCAFVTVKFLGGGELVWTGIINIIVHSIMYLYYLLSSLDSKWKNHMGFKRFLTHLQLAQFLANVLIYGRLWFVDCSFPTIVSLFYVPQNLFMLVLFGDFYVKTYIIKRSKKT